MGRTISAWKHDIVIFVHGTSKSLPTLPTSD